MIESPVIYRRSQGDLIWWMTVGFFGHNESELHYIGTTGRDRVVVCLDRGQPDREYFCIR